MAAIENECTKCGYTELNYQCIDTCPSCGAVMQQFCGDLPEPASKHDNHYPDELE